MLSWVNDSFLYSPGEDAVTSPHIHIAYMSLRTHTPLVFKLEPSEGGQVRRGMLTMITVSKCVCGERVCVGGGGRGGGGYHNLPEISSLGLWFSVTENLANVSTECFPF